MVLSVAVGFLVAVGLTPLLAAGARRRGFLDVPNARSSHVVATPRTGGAAFVPAVLIGVAVAGANGSLSGDTRLVVAAAAAVALLGFIDDLRSLTAATRLLVQTAVASMLVFLLDWQILPTAPAWVGGLVTVLWIVACTNAYNFMDGIDGIAGGQAVVAALTWGILGAAIGSHDVVVVGAVTAAAVSGFLIYNWPPARVFMGDAGSAFLGFLFAAMPLAAAGHGPAVSIWAALVVWPFLFDTGFTLIRRIRRRENIFSAHRSHLYQRLTITGLPHSRVTMLYVALALIGAAASVALAGDVAGAAVLATVAIALSASALCGYVIWREANADGAAAGRRASSD